VQPLRTKEYGARGYQALDVEDHLWYVGKYQPSAYWGS